MLRLVEFGHELVEQAANALARLLEGGGQLGQRERLVGDVDDGFQHGLELRVFHGDGGRGLGRQQIVHGHGGFRRSGGESGVPAASSAPRIPLGGSGVS